MASEDVITLGIGSAPGSITPFVLVGLSASQVAVMVATSISGTGNVGLISGTGSMDYNAEPYGEAEAYAEPVPYGFDARGIIGSGSSGAISGTGGV